MPSLSTAENLVTLRDLKLFVTDLDFACGCITAHGRTATERPILIPSDGQSNAKANLIPKDRRAASPCSTSLRLSRDFSMVAVFPSILVKA